MGTWCDWKSVVNSETSNCWLTVLSASMVKRDNDSRPHEDSLRIQGSCPFYTARNERYDNGGHLSTPFVATATLFRVTAFHVDVPFEIVLQIKIDGQTGRTAIDFRFAFDTVVDRDVLAESQKCRKYFHVKRIAYNIFDDDPLHLP
uniref:Uncharacterized protein n=1 Tax=Romanomermis culicivorax TaxID=13658 RepID=A0A915J631_ROMCU